MGGTWSEGVLEVLLDKILDERILTSAGVFVGTESHGRLQVGGVITTVEGAPTGALPLDEEIWAWVHTVLEEHYEDHGLIGWYVARPGLGAMPTEVDAAIHVEYFGAPEHVLLCADPGSGELAAYALDPSGDLIEIGSSDVEKLFGIVITTKRRILRRRRPTS